MGIFRTSSQGDSISRNPERTPKRQGEVPGYIEVLQQMTGHLNIKRLLLKKTRWPKSRNLALFYVWEAARVWVHWNHSFDTCLSFQGPVSCFHLPKFLRAHHREWLQSDGHKMASILSFLSPNPNHEFPQGSRAHYLWWLLWQEVFHLLEAKWESWQMAPDLLKKQSPESLASMVGNPQSLAQVHTGLFPAPEIDNKFAFQGS